MPTTHPILIKNARIVDPSRLLDAVGDILLKDGYIAHASGPLESVPEGAQVLNATGLVVTPGFIDLHCHLREPGYENRETIATGMQAAARGGFTTICCMPNTMPSIDSASVVEFIRNKARQVGTARVLPIGAVTRGREGKTLAELEELADAGVVAFSDDGAPVADASLLRAALLYLLPHSLPIIDHCEEPSLAQDGVVNEGILAFRLGLPAMPRAAEEIMVARDIALSAMTGGHIHLAHISTAGSLQLLRRAKEQGVPITAEVTPHHLTLTEDWVAGKGGKFDSDSPLTPWAYDTMAKVNPPLRTQEDIAALISGIKEGVIDVIATDHAPHTSTDKLVPYEEAAWGISGLETALGSLLSLFHSRQLPLSTLIERLTAGPARLLGKAGSNLGTLSPGAVADVVIFDPDVDWVVNTEDFASKGKNTPLAGAMLKGKVMATIYSGQLVHSELTAQSSTEHAPNV